MNHFGDEFALQVLTDWLLHFLNHIVNSNVRIISKLLWLEWEFVTKSLKYFQGNTVKCYILKHRGVFASEWWEKKTSTRSRFLRLSKFIESHVYWFWLLQKKLSGAFEPIFMAGAVIWTDYSTKVQMQGGCLEVRMMKL